MVKSTEDQFFDLTLTKMITGIEKERPTALEISKTFQPEHKHRKDSLILMLNSEKNKNNQLER